MSGIQTYRTASLPEKSNDNYHYQKEYVCPVKEKRMNEDKVHPGDGSKGDWGRILIILFYFIVIIGGAGFGIYLFFHSLGVI